jgi:CheY-like chemotaxis protein
MHGKISVESRVGKGTTFHVYLPPAANPEAQSCLPEAEVEDEPIATTAATMLYIEDNPTNLKLVDKIISRHPNWRLVSAVSGVLGLEAARKHNPSCILLDLHLPDISGDQVFDRLRADPETAHIPVVMLSADATQGQVKRLKQAGVAEYLTKPLDVKLLLSTLENVIGAGALVNEIES